MKTSVMMYGAAVLLAAGVLPMQGAQPERKPLPVLSEAELGRIDAALPEKAAAAPKQPRRLLVFHRCEGFVHGGGIVAGNRAIESMGKKTGAFAVDISEDYGVFTPDNLPKYDVVVLNNTTQLKLSSEARQALLDFVRGGKGLVGIHAATDNFYDWPEGAAMLGGVFDGHPWGGNGTWAFKLDDPKHALNRAFGGQGFKLKDEIYQFKEPYTREDRRVLLTLDLSDPATGGVQKGVKRADKDFAVAWVKSEQKGRVFFCGLGHERNVFMEPAVMQFLLDGIQYAAGDLRANARPRQPGRAR